MQPRPWQGREGVPCGRSPEQASRRQARAVLWRRAVGERAYAVVDVATVITVHLTEVIKENMAELLDYASTP